MALWVVDWAAAGKLAWDLAKAYWAYLGDVADDEQRESDRDHIIRVIALTRTQILDRIDEIEAGELRGEFEGFETIYSSYDPDPDNPVEEERLRGLIDDSARVLGRLGGHLDDVGEHPKMAFEMWVVYVALLYLRAQAMAERQVTYGANETNDERLQRSRSAVETRATLNNLIDLGIGVGEVRLIEGRVTRAKQEYPVEAKANSPTDLNWFS